MLPAAIYTSGSIRTFAAPINEIRNVDKAALRLSLPKVRFVLVATAVVEFMSFAAAAN